MRAAGAHTYLEKMLQTFTRKKRMRWRACHRRARRFGAHDRAARDGDMRAAGQRRDVGVPLAVTLRPLTNANVLSTQNWYSAWNTPILNDIHNTLQTISVIMIFLAADESVQHFNSVDNLTPLLE